MSPSIDSPDYPDPMMNRPGPTATVAKVYAVTILCGILALLLPWYFTTTFLTVIAYGWHKVKD